MVTSVANIFPQSVLDRVNALQDAFHVFDTYNGAGVWMRDPYIVIGPDDRYYMTNTDLSSDYNKVRFPLWGSDNLADWTLTGRPYAISDLSYWETFDKDNLRLWAPEIHFINDKWVLVHTTSNNYSAIAI